MARHKGAEGSDIDEEAHFVDEIDDAVENLTFERFQDDCLQSSVSRRLEQLPARRTEYLMMNSAIPVPGWIVPAEMCRMLSTVMM